MANGQHVKLLHQGREIWNAWRAGNSMKTVDLSGADLSEAELGRFDLQQVNLSQANLRGADLSEANLQGANLSQANLRDVSLQDANLHRAIVSETCLCKADLSRAILTKANLLQADLSGTKCSDANFHCASLYEANLQWADLTSVDLSSAALRFANLRHAQLLSANLDHADMMSTNLTLADLSQASMKGVNLRSSNLSNAQLVASDLSGADLSLANLMFADLSLAIAQAVVLKHTILLGTNLEGADLRNCVMGDVTTRYVKITKTLQSPIIIEDEDENSIIIDDIEAAHFLSLLAVAQTMKYELRSNHPEFIAIIGNFSLEREKLRTMLEEKIRNEGYKPALLKRGKNENGDLGEMIAHIQAAFALVIIDFTDAQDLFPLFEKMASQSDFLIQPLLDVSKSKQKKLPWSHGGHPYIKTLPLYTYQDHNEFAEFVQEKLFQISLKP